VVFLAYRPCLSTCTNHLSMGCQVCVNRHADKQVWLLLLSLQTAHSIQLASSMAAGTWRC
jgi:hypothetical protein